MDVGSRNQSGAVSCLLDLIVKSKRKIGSIWFYRPPQSVRIPKSKKKSVPGAPITAEIGSKNGI